MGAILTRWPRRPICRAEPPRNVDLRIWALATQRATSGEAARLPDFACSGPGIPPGDPTPEEITEACQAIQATWSPGERLRRLIPRIGGQDDVLAMLEEEHWRPPRFG